MSDHHHESNSDFGSKFLLGVIAGAAFTYIFATKTGQKIRKELLADALKIIDDIGEELAEKEEAVKEKIEDKKEDIEKKLEEKVESAQKAAKEKLEQVGETAKQEAVYVKENIEEQIREVPQQVQEVQKKGRHFFFRKRHNQHES